LCINVRNELLSKQRPERSISRYPGSLINWETRNNLYSCFKLIILTNSAHDKWILKKINEQIQKRLLPVEEHFYQMA